jgi:sulfur-oxidizing protein SoxZ
MTARTLIDKPERAKPGDVIRIRALIGHPMESGFRVDAAGKLVPRRIIRRFTCHEVASGGGETLVFGADFHPAVAANPYVAFHLVAPSSRTQLNLRWSGDEGFEHTETVTLEVA